MGSSEEEFSLTWKEHTQEAFNAFVDLRLEKRFVDVTVVCQNTVFRAHRVVLAACSGFFDRLLSAVTKASDGRYENAVVALANVDPVLLEYALDFIYSGKVTVPNARLEKFIQLAELLEISGLKGETGKAAGWSRPNPLFVRAYCFQNHVVFALVTILLYRTPINPDFLSSSETHRL
jgi:hypothetical protein